MAISNLVERLNYSADLVEYLTVVKLDNGKTVPESLTFDGICFWDFFTAELAHIHIPQVLLSKTLKLNMWHYIKPDLIKAKYRVNHILHNTFSVEGCSQWPNNSNVLCLAFTNRMYVDILQPLVGHLDDRKEVSVTVLEDKKLPALKDLPSGDVVYQSLWEHWASELKDESMMINRAISESGLHLELPVLLERILPEEYKNLVPNFEELFYRLFKAYLPLAVPYFVVARHILNKHRPSVVLTTDTADSRTRIFSSLCKNMGIPSIDIQFGLAGDEAVEWRFLLADYVAVWGDSSKNAILNQKVNRDRILLTGSPRHDILINANKLNIQVERRRMGIPEANSVILLASTYHFNSTNHADVKVLFLMHKAISNAAATIPGITLIVKPHPHEDVRETRKHFSTSVNIIFADKDLDIKNFIKISDAFVSYGSTTTIDALIAGTLTICPIFPGWVFSSDVFKDSGATLVPETEEEVYSIFEGIANGTFKSWKADLEENRQRFLKNFVFEPNGQASLRIAEIVTRISCSSCSISKVS